MKKGVGYVISILGIGIMAIGFGMVPLKLDILNIIPAKYIGGVGLVLVGVGVLVALMDKGRSRKIGSGRDEVPIYEGVGKKRRIVGYRKG